MPTDRPNDQQVLLLTHSGCERSASLLWASHAPRLLAFARAIVGAADADDVVQSVFCGLLDLPRARVRAIRDVPAFLAASTRRAALNSLRLARRERARRQASGTPRPAVAQGSTEGLEAALDRLPRRQREVIVLKHTVGLTFEQMGLALGIPRDTAASRYRAGIGSLRRLLEKPSDVPDEEVAHAC